MYILIFESGEIKKASSICDDDLESIGQGVLDIIDISNPSDPKYYYDLDDWRSLESADE